MTSTSFDPHYFARFHQHRHRSRPVVNIKLLDTLNLVLMCVLSAFVASKLGLKAPDDAGLHRVDADRAIHPERQERQLPERLVLL